MRQSTTLWMHPGFNHFSVNIVKQLIFYLFFVKKIKNRGSTKMLNITREPVLRFVWHHWSSYSSMEITSPFFSLLKSRNFLKIFKRVYCFISSSGQECSPTSPALCCWYRLDSRMSPQIRGLWRSPTWHLPHGMLRQRVVVCYRACLEWQGSEHNTEQRYWTSPPMLEQRGEEEYVVGRQSWRGCSRHSLSSIILVSRLKQPTFPEKTDIFRGLRQRNNLI